MDTEEYIIVRDIHGHKMFYSGLTPCCTPRWVDDPMGALVFIDKERVEKCLRFIQDVSKTVFTISIIPDEFTKNGEQKEI